MNLWQSAQAKWLRHPVAAAVALGWAALALFGLMLPLRSVAAGFPLDDAWIHQTYARNLALRGEFAFVAGQPSAGSTAPLWTLLLAPGQWLGLAPFLWAGLLGALSLAALTWAAAELATALFAETPEERPRAAAWAALAVALEWHLLWGAASGMETVLFAAGALALLAQAVRWSTTPPELKRVFALGCCVGVLALLRPEGMALAGPLGLALLWSRRERRREWLIGGLALAGGMLLLLAPYAALNWRLSGTVFPNTFYAKQQEYRALYAALYPVRLARLLTPLLAGPLALLLPALAWALPRNRQQIGRWLPLLWVLGMWGLYAWRLPVTYQHGRYLLPIMPPLLIYGAGGLERLARRSTAGAAWVISRAWVGAALLATLAFVGIGANAYATDVAVINGEMVAVAQWVAANTPADAVIAAHDIGALGYFAQRPLLDLAGLVSPEVIPFIRDEARLLRWMEAQGADYMVTFPSWYPALTRDPRLAPVYRTDLALTRALGEDNMVIYRWQP